ncbi:hypothetical protein [Streptomyces tendae]
MQARPELMRSAPRPSRRSASARSARQGPSGSTGLFSGNRLGNLALPNRMVMAHRRTLRPVPAG